jgi:hypothetical protein
MKSTTEASQKLPDVSFNGSDFQKGDPLSATHLATTHEQVCDTYMEGIIDKGKNSYERVIQE